MDATLYVVATPIGNLEEMTPRAIAVLKDARMIACEDTRETMKLCTHFGIETPLMSCHEHNEYYVADKIVELLKKGETVAIVTDAGYPGISDPGAEVIRRCIEHRIKVIVVSGPCAIINAVVGSGLNTQHFFYYGFLESRRSDRRRELATLAKIESTMVFYEAPHRIEDTLQDMLEIFGDRKVSIGRELTKKYEEFVRGKIAEILARIKQEPLKGEMVVVVEGATPEPVASISEMEILKMVNELINDGMSASDAIKRVATLTKMKKNEVYHMFHQN